MPSTLETVRNWDTAHAPVPDRHLSSRPKAGFSTELHAARGLAAVVVVVGHCLAVQDSQSELFSYARALFAGSTAVTFFFVLSGLVLAHSLRKAETIDFETYRHYLVRRIFRLAPLLFATVILGTVYCNWLDPKKTYAVASDWWDMQFKSHIDLVHFVGAMTGFSPRPNPPSWSIFVEMVGSLFIPFMVLTVRAGNKHVVALASLLLVFGLITVDRIPAFQTHQWNLYLIDFFCGVLILDFGKRSFGRLGANLPAARIAVAVLLLALLNVRYFGVPFFGDDRWGSWVVNLVELSLIVPIVGVLFYGRQAFGFLNAAPVQFLGNISYSLYLIHFLILAVVVNTVATWFAPEPGLVLLGLVVVLEFAICIPLAFLTYRLIELPGLRLGREFVSYFMMPTPQVGQLRP